MRVGTRELRNTTASVIAAVQTGEHVELTVRGEPVADIVPHGRRTRWLSGATLQAALTTRDADAGLTCDLANLAGQTLDEALA
ncbi:MAG: type II toxin-antitoxin system prevent-host-death family antitoxin [Actinomycetia bacterium]|nr:type II toxin-antitoxin system prevent-host-death family antitoxin [Actinomycetes bacterium]